MECAVGGYGGEEHLRACRLLSYPHADGDRVDADSEPRFRCLDEHASGRDQESKVAAAERWDRALRAAADSDGLDGRRWSDSTVLEEKSAAAVLEREPAGAVLFLYEIARHTSGAHSRKGEHGWRRPDWRVVEQRGGAVDGARLVVAAEIDLG